MLTISRIFVCSLLLSTLSIHPARATDIKFATWNLNWLTLRSGSSTDLPADVLPRTDRYFGRLAFYARALNADVVALQEVDGPDAAARLFSPADYDIAMTNDHVVQRVGFAIRHGIHWHRNPDLTALDLNPDAPHPLRAGADITLDFPGGGILRVLAIHLKSGCQFSPLNSHRFACRELRAQIAPIVGWINARQAEGTPFLIMGDFNRRMDRPDGFWERLSGAAPLLRATEGKANPCWGGEGFIDHILAGGAARGWLEPDSLRVLVYREQDPELKDQLSDHCPVSVQLALPEAASSR